MASPSLQQQNVQVAARLMAPDDLVITGDSPVIFEDDVMCGTKVRIIASGREIRIGARAWLGDNAEIRASVGPNSIIVTNSGVTEDVPPNVVVDGSPAKYIWQIC